MFRMRKLDQFCLQPSTLTYLIRNLDKYDNVTSYHRYYLWFIHSISIHIFLIYMNLSKLNKSNYKKYKLYLNNKNIFKLTIFLI